MKSLNKFIFRKQYFTLKYREIFQFYPVLLFLKYDGIPTNIVNLLRVFCINNKISINLINSKYIDIFLFRKFNLNNISWLKNDIILLAFTSIDNLISSFSNENFCFFLNPLKITGLSINNYLLNLYEFNNLITLNNSNFYKDLYDYLILLNVSLISLFSIILYDFIILFECIISSFEKKLN